ncbi:MAG TPA: tRNA-dihydrouridine synthase [Synergistales bacterium]|nr:tRNA-dihydrouridine synthase [Synergistales bacterium]
MRWTEGRTEISFDAGSFPAKVGGVDVENPVWLAPLAGITIPPVRSFFRQLGAGLVHTEMVSCAGLVHGSRKTFSMLRTADGERPVVLQLFAADAETLLEGARMALDRSSFEALGINMACPMPKVTRRGAGSGLLERPGIAAAMVKALVPLGLPVWAKIRRPPMTSPMDTLTFSGMLLEAGVSHVCIHGRQPSQKYGGKADNSVVLEAARAFPGRIAASGDIFTPGDAKRMLDGGCSAVFVARGAFRDPFLIPAILEGCGFTVDPGHLADSPGSRIDLMISLGERILSEEGEKAAIVLLKRFLSGIFRGLYGASRFRQAVSRSSSWGEMRAALEEWKASPERGEQCDRREASRRDRSSGG